MLSTGTRDSILNVFRATTFTSITPFAGLLASISSWRTPTATETAYTGYGTRPAITFGAPADASPAVARQIANSALVTFPQNTGADVSVIGWGIYSAATAGTLHGIALLDADQPILGTGAATGELVTAPAHGLSTDQRVFVLGVPGGAIPTGLSEGTAYFVLAAGLTADAFALSLTSGGAAVNITANGAALFIPYTAQTIAASSTPEFAIGQLVYQV